jgi:hypothetical protein
MSNTVPIPDHSKLPNPNADTVSIGTPILPIKRVELFSADEWENFVEEWANVKKDTYDRVERCGGAGDMGRDVIAWPDYANPSIWDNFQCKHYDHPLYPSEIWSEFGKLVYYTFKKEFSYPRSYSFVAPQGVGTRLSNLLKKPLTLKEELIKNWDKSCKKQITDKEDIDLEGDLLEHLNKLDFSIFSYIPPLRLIDEHRESPYHITRFGGGLPQRPQPSLPPETPDDIEVNYIRKLLDAYGDRDKAEYSSIDELVDKTDFLEHLKDSRVEFYSAEALKGFSRDTLPKDVYNQLQEEIHSGIKDDIRMDHNDGYSRVLAVVKTAKSLQLTSNPLIYRMHNRDRGGICHQLANEKDEVKWVRD